MAKATVYMKAELAKVFRLTESGGLERLLKRNGVWISVENKANTAKGYCDVKYQGKQIRYHRIVYILVNGDILDNTLVIDHLDGDKLNNAIDNLRLCRHRDNDLNKSKHRTTNIRGCYYHKKYKKWQAQIWVGSKRVSLGYYETAELAMAIYLKAYNLIELYVDNESFRSLVNTAASAVANAAASV